MDPNTFLFYFGMGAPVIFLVSTIVNITGEEWAEQDYIFPLLGRFLQFISFPFFCVSGLFTFAHIVAPVQYLVDTVVYSTTGVRIYEWSYTGYILVASGTILWVLIFALVIWAFWPRIKSMHLLRCTR